MNTIKPGQIYQHYKGNKYKIIALAKHSETLDDMVIYETLYDNPLSKVWARPRHMFQEMIEIDGRKTLRFTLIG